MSKMRSEDYPASYYEGGVGSEYNGYGDDPGWPLIADACKLFYAKRPGVMPVLYDIGCAKGYFVREARRVGFDAYGLDISQYAIDSAPSDVTPYVQQGNVVSLPWDDTSADVVHTGEFMEHIYPDELDQSMSEILRVLKPGGLFLNRIGIAVESDHPFAGQDSHETHHYLIRTRREWEDYFASIGMVRVPEAEALLDDWFQNRDWVRRFFVWRKPGCVHVYGDINADPNVVGLENGLTICMYCGERKA